MTRGLELDDKRKDRYNAKTYGAIRTADEGSGKLDCEPIGCATTETRQPLLECMAETTQKLDAIESKIARLTSILFGQCYHDTDACYENGDIANVEREANEARSSVNRIYNDLTNIIERLAD